MPLPDAQLSPIPAARPGRRPPPAALLVALLLAAGPAAAQNTVRVTVTNTGAQATLGGQLPSVTRDGRFVAFASTSPDLNGGTPNTPQVVVHDRDADGNGVFDDAGPALAVVSVSAAGVPGNSASTNPSISGDGRYVAFLSAATNIVPPDNGNVNEIYVHDRDFDGNGIFDDAAPFTRKLGSPNGHCFEPRFSDDGRYVVFMSQATNLVSGDNNNRPDVFRWDRFNGQIELVSVSLTGGVGDTYSKHGQLSDDGRFVIFTSASTNLVSGPIGPPDQVYLRDMLTGVTSLVSRDSSGAPADQFSDLPSISGDGSVVAFRSYANLDPRDTGFDSDAYVRDLTTGVTELVSLSSTGQELTVQNTIEPELSADGRRVSFASNATNAVPGASAHRDVYVRDLDRGTTVLASVGWLGQIGDGHSADFTGHDISADGNTVVFTSQATNLVPNDTNGNFDVFAHDLCTHPAVDLGFGKVGSNGLVPTLSACGGTASGQQIDFTLGNGQPNRRAAIYLAPFSQPRPFRGGTLVPKGPGLIRRLAPTDGSGSATFSLPGGGGPMDLYVQWVMRDVGASFDIGLSNALRLTLLP